MSHTWYEMTDIHVTVILTNTALLQDSSDSRTAQGRS